MIEIILVQGFCPLKIKITQFPNGFHHNRLATILTYAHCKLINNILQSRKANNYG